MYNLLSPRKRSSREQLSRITRTDLSVNTGPSQPSQGPLEYFNTAQHHGHGNSGALRCCVLISFANYLPQEAEGQPSQQAATRHRAGVKLEHQYAVLAHRTDGTRLRQNRRFDTRLVIQGFLF
ncbi:hypothetical protein RRG08_001095 [Elysia crispata]|uniref:Uncharacterized protein n=1 Tax=Elysia crispata TaxID=231223 RepID=A0AAE1AVW0_9GAST|nr:hypothetical protein RRG08_001095 [Elysia crispata]